MQRLFDRRTGLLAWVLGMMLFLSAGATATAATPDGAGPDVVVRQSADGLIRSLRAEGAGIVSDPDRLQVLVEETIMPAMDLDSVGRWVLGKHWRSASAEQRQRFLDEFRVLLMQGYGGTLLEYADATITYLPPRLDAAGETATVRSQVVASGEVPIALDYSLHQTPAGWKVYDITVEGISLVATYRGTFAEEIRSHGLDGLIQRLAQRNRNPGQQPG